MKFYLIKQNQNFSEDLERGIITLPAGVSQESQALFQQITPEDLIFNVVDGEVVAMSSALAPAENQEMKVEYEQLDEGVKLADYRDQLGEENQETLEVSIEGQEDSRFIIPLSDDQSSTIIASLLESSQDKDKGNALLKDIAFAVGNVSQFTKNLF